MRTIQDNKDNRINKLGQEIAELQTSNEALKDANKALRDWIVKLGASKIELASSYREDMRILDAMKERYSASYAQHIRNTPLPE